MTFAGQPTSPALLAPSVIHAPPDASLSSLPPPPSEPLPEALPRPQGWSIGLLERVRIILRGGSVIDWYRLGFDDVDEVREFLKVNGYDVSREADEERVRSLLAEAAEYLRVELDIDVPRELWAPERIETPFLVASSRSDEPGDVTAQRTACKLLKLVHTLNHLEARELRLGLALPETEVFARVEAAVDRELRALHGEGIPIIRLDKSRKTRDSTITKLLSKRRATAAQIMDRLRFRVVVERRADIPPLLAGMTRRLVPFNHVIPEESTNDLIDFARFAHGLPTLRPWLGSLQFRLDLEKQEPLAGDINECSADEFRMLNFVIDVPVRVDDVMVIPSHAHLRHLGHVVFVSAEFQVYDRATWDANERNTAASHEAYKSRQKERVARRLRDGLEREYNND